MKLKVLREGEHLVIMANPTSVDQVGFAARRAGYEVRDCFSIQMPCSTCIMGLLCRKPFGATLTEQVVRSGSGALDIDAGRIDLDAGDPNMRPNAKNHDINPTNPVCYSSHGVGRTGDMGYHNSKGRFPANFLLVHGPDCVCEGTRKVRGATGNGDAPIGEHGKLVPLRRGTFVSRTNAEGLEEIPKWDCQPDCPVRILDLQSGVGKSPESYMKATTTSNVHAYGAGIGQVAGSVSENYGDEGGASRFFFQTTGYEGITAYIQNLTFLTPEEY